MSIERILITGAAKRLGRIMALGLTGAERMIVVHYNSSDSAAEKLARDIEAGGGTAICVQADLENADEAKGLVEKAAKQAGGAMTGLVNNASVFDYDSPEAVDTNIMKTAYAVNAQAPVLLASAFYQQAERGANNVIINMLDQKLWNLNPDFFSYTNSKMALHGGHKMMAQKYAGRVRVNAIAPGSLLPSFEQSQEEFVQMASRNLLETPIDPAQIGAAADYIFTSKTLQGQVLHVDNGQHFVKQARDPMFEETT